MKSIRTIFLLLSLMCAGAAVQAQPFWGYQAIGIHNFFFSINWNGQQPELGVGYAHRQSWSGFTEFSAEWRAPMSDLFSCDHQSWILGAYGPMRLRGRPFLGMGMHLRIQNRLAAGSRHTRYTLAGTLLPSYAFLAPLAEAPYFTGGLRATGLLTLADKAKGAEEATWLTAWGTELGGNLSLHLERTVGISLNGTYGKMWNWKADDLSGEELDWTIKGGTHIGSTYYLERW